ncbi:MAG: hypothetical protein ACKOSQ_04275 [Planctomycetaceae bacterium]
MARRRRNPFYLLLGVAGLAFTLTAVSSAVAVLRGVRPETAAARGAHPIDRVLDRHGTAILVGELVVLAIATVGAVVVDHVEGERQRAERDVVRGPAGAAPPGREP